MSLPPSKLRRESRHSDVVQRHTPNFAVHICQHVLGLRSRQLAGQVAPALVRVPQLELRALTREAREVLQRAQPAIESRRRHLEYIAARQRVLDVEPSP